MSIKASAFWQRMGTLAFLLLAVLAWATLLWTPERSSQSLSSETSAYELYLSGHYAASYETLMRSELLRRSLNEASAGALERLLFDLYMEPSLRLPPQKLADAFNLLSSRHDVPPSRRAVWAAYEAELLTLHQQNYSVAGFLNKVESLQQARKSLAGQRPLDIKKLQVMNESFRVYFHHGLKKWFEEKPLERPTLRWLFAAGLSGSLYYAQGRDQLEEFLERCRETACSPADVAQTKDALRLIMGLDAPLEDEVP